MKKRKINYIMLILISSLLKTNMVNATEIEENIQISAEQNYFNTIGQKILETDTSIVYDMKMMPAKQLTSNKYNGNPNNPYGYLKVPAQITKQGNFYFIVDSYNNQVLYSRNMDSSTKQWKVMTSDVKYPHAVASDGQVYLVADTDNHRILVFEWMGGGFKNTQVFENIGVRPHYITYDVQTGAFFAWSSMTGDMYILKRDAVTGIMYIQEVRHIKELENFYVRSFTIAGDLILFPSGNNCNVLVADKNTLEVKWRYPVTPDIAGMAFIQPIGNYFYMTVSTDLTFNQNVATMIRTPNLESLALGQYEKVYDKFPRQGVPYYIDYFNGMYYMTNHGTPRSVYKFNIINDQICSVSSLY